MEVTVHGLEHINDRTKMRPEDLCSIIDAGALISLGFDEYNIYEYLLFYSPNDKSCRIAVTSANRVFLVSVWKVGYSLPHTVVRPTPEIIVRATMLFQNFLFERIKKNLESLSHKEEETNDEGVQARELGAESFTTNDRQTPSETEIFSTPVNGHLFNIGLQSVSEPTLILSSNETKQDSYQRYFAQLQVLSGSGKVFKLIFEHKPVPVPKKIQSSVDLAISFLKEYLCKIGSTLQESGVELIDIHIRIKFVEKNNTRSKKLGYFFDLNTMTTLLKNT